MPGGAYSQTSVNNRAITSWPASSTTAASLPYNCDHSATLEKACQILVEDQYLIPVSVGSSFMRLWNTSSGDSGPYVVINAQTKGLHMNTFYVDAAL